MNFLKLLQFLILLMACTLVFGCETQDLVFFTNTTIGAEVSVSPADGSGPAKLVIGYKRQEGVLDPIYSTTGMEGYALNVQDPNANNKPSLTPTSQPVQRALIKKYRPESSVIAKIDSDTSASATGAANGSLSSAQWFATGTAATNLSVQPGIAGAVTGSSEIAKASSTAAHFGVKLTGVPADDAMTALQFAYKTLQGLSNDSTAQKDVSDLDQMSQALSPTTYKSYSQSAATTLKETSYPLGAAPSSVNFEALVEYRTNLKISTDTLTIFLAMPTFQYQAAGAAVSSPVQKNDPTWSQLNTTLSQQQKALSIINTELSNDSAVLDVFNYFIKVVTQ